MLLVWVRIKFEPNEYVRIGYSNSCDSTVVYEDIGEFNSTCVCKKSSLLSNSRHHFLGSF